MAAHNRDESSPLIDRDVRDRVRTCILPQGTNQSVIRVLLQDVARPSHNPAHGEDWGKQVCWNAHIVGMPI